MTGVQTCALPICENGDRPYRPRFNNENGDRPQRAYSSDAYDTVILATPVWHGSPVPAVNAFLHKVDLRGRAISGLLLYDGRHAAKAMDTLRERVRLAGGACRDVVCISAKELREKNCSGNRSCTGSLLAPQRAVEVNRRFSSENTVVYFCRKPAWA